MNIGTENNERSPIADSAAGEIATIIHNEGKGGKVLGFDRKANENAQEPTEVSEQGIIIGKKVDFSRKLLDFFNKWVSETKPNITQPLYDYVVDVFQVVFEKSARVDGNGHTHYMKDVYPIMKIIAKPLVETEDLRKIIEVGMLVRASPEISEYGQNPDWIQWSLERNSNAGDQTKSLIPEPAYYSGRITAWNETYGCSDNVLNNINIHNTRFCIPAHEIKGILKAYEITNEFKKLIDELEKAKS